MIHGMKENDYGQLRGPLGVQWCAHPDRPTCDCDACHSDSIERTKRAERNRKARESRAVRNDTMRSLGLVKVRGALGGTYWE